MSDWVLLWEAVNSVALSHDEGCECRVCRAAGGDKEAWQDIVVADALKETTWTR